MEEQRLLKKKLKAASNSNSLISACTDLASYYTSVGHFSKAIREFQTLCSIYKDERQMILYAQANRGIGEAYMGLSQFEEALKYFKVYYDISVEETNILEQQRALAQMGHLYLTWYLETVTERSDKKLLEEAYSYFMKSMKKCESLMENVEKQDMVARLFANLGLVKESLGEYDTAFNLYEKSIKICIKNDLYEQLYRDYLAMASLLDKRQKYQEAVKNFNFAVEVAKKLSSKRVELMCAALLAKSQTLIRIADFHGAKQVLRKAFKYKTPSKEERKIIENQLRVVAAMCKIEDEIIVCNNQKQLKSLYEKMGDGACTLKNYHKATEYYEKMLQAAERCGVSGKELAECYYSLAETYKDIEDYSQAEYYFEKEYSMHEGNLKERLNTTYKLVDLKEAAGHSLHSIRAVYQRGLDECKQSPKEGRRLANRFMAYLRQAQCHQEAFKMEQHLKDLYGDLLLDEDDNSSLDYESEDSAKPHIGDDIVLSDVTDLSEDSDTELQASKRRKTTNNSVKFKKNLNGEWPLHLACIKGNIKMVQYWLDVDHPINVRDNAGWLPIHEAAVHGHMEVVRLLLDHKAAINDRGGAECNGITPLHDAASNGHLEVVQLLLDRGANAVAKTDDGNTALFELRRWYDRTDADLRGEEVELYNSLVKRLEAALEKAGQTDVGGEHVNEASVFVFDEDEEEEQESNEYQMVMDSLRKLPPKKPEIARRKQASLINDTDYVDNADWLENDLVPTSKGKKRKLSRNSSVTISDSGEPKRRSSTGSTSSTSRRRQVTLLDSGFRKSSSPIQSVVEADSTTMTTTSTAVGSPFKIKEAGQNMLSQDPMLFVDVEIEKKVFRVPVLMSQIGWRTIKWLAEEAANRYESKEYMRPRLELEASATGAILDDNDVLSLLFPMGCMQAERVVGKVTEWNVSSVSERYRDTCLNMGTEVNQQVIDLTSNLSFNLDLSDRNFGPNDLAPLFKSVHNQKTITEIDLSGNHLDTSSVTLFCTATATLPNLITLNLSCTSLRPSELSQLSHCLTLSNLKSLNISDNPLLKNAALKEISVLAGQTQLVRLHLANVGMTDVTVNEDISNWQHLEDLDISYNELGDESIKKILRWANKRVLKRLHVSRMLGGKVLANFLEGEDIEIGLEVMDIVGGATEDADISKLLRAAPNLSSLNLAYSPNVTGISLSNLLAHDNLSELNVSACPNVWTNWDDTVSVSSIKFGSGVKRTKCYFRVSSGCRSNYERLADVFREKFKKEKIQVKITDCLLSVIIFN